MSELFLELIYASVLIWQFTFLVVHLKQTKAALLEILLYPYFILFLKVCITGLTSLYFFIK